uniref:Uncharacterized protein n=1 Tax=Coccolithus braarudii TaxID=221442 RepID=A0A7S0Q4I9_9EUKA
MRTCLVESGCHSAQLQHFYPHDRAEFVASSVAQLLPSSWFSHFKSMESRRKQVGRCASQMVTSPAHADADLQSWMLTHGNLVYNAGRTGDKDTPLILQLRDYFDSHEKLGVISVKDAELGLAQLGVGHEGHDELVRIKIATMPAAPWATMDRFAKERLEIDSRSTSTSASTSASSCGESRGGVVSSS